MSILHDAFPHSSRLQRVFALILGCNMVLIVWGIHVVPAMFTPLGIATTIGALGMQVVIGCLAFFGPLSFQHSRSHIGIAFPFGVLFGLFYMAILISDYVPGVNWDVNMWLLFVCVASLAGFVVGYQTRKFSDGLIAAGWALVIGTAIWSIGVCLLNYANWGSQAWFNFWLKDGAIDEFRQSGNTDLNLFLLQDIQGALFFHPLLSVFLGAICGSVASGLAQVVRLLLKR